MKSKSFHIKKELGDFYLTKPHYSGAFVCVVLNLCLAIIISNLSWSGVDLKVNGELVFDKGEYWRLLTSAFAHGDLDHLLSNMPGFLGLSYLIVRYFSIKVLMSLLIAGAIGVNFFTLKAMLDHIYLVGLSGVVYLLWGFWFCLYIILDRITALSRRFMKVVAISLLLLVPSSFHPNISYTAHLVGLLLGLVAGLIYFICNRKKLRSFEKFVIRTDAKTHHPLVPFAKSYTPWPFAKWEAIKSKRRFKDK